MYGTCGMRVKARREGAMGRDVDQEASNKALVLEAFDSLFNRRAGVGLSSSLAEHEKAIVENALRATRGRVYGPSGAAARLGIPRSTLESKIRALRIDKSRFRTLATKSS
jgi:DNA-binding NtrC family response regulator